MDHRFKQIKRIACIGEVMIELVEDHQDRPQLNVAGDTYNTAVYLKRLLNDPAVTVSYVTALGEDHFSAKILGAFKQHNIDDSFVEQRPDRVPGIYAIETTPDGERRFIYWRSESAARTLFQTPCKINFDSLKQFDMVFLSGITLAILPPDIRQALFIALDAFRKEGGLVGYDSNHRPRLWRTPNEARAANMAMWANADLALPSVDDEMALFEETHEDQIINRLAKVGAKFGALKRGALGPRSLTETDSPQNYQAVKSVTDTTAAGDSFNAGVLAGLINGVSLDQALMLGHQTSSRVIQTQGAIIQSHLF